MDFYPQAYGWHTPGVPEELSVSIAQQETYMSYPTAHGRSYHKGSEPPLDQRDTLGRNFAEQWTRALEVDPAFIFITGWNEWAACRLEDQYGNTRFLDTYTQEFSRDIEPMKDGHTDNYYYQMIANIRRYKGVRQPTAPSTVKTINIDGSFSDWDDVAPEYVDHIGDTTHRNCAGWGSAGTYVNTTGRNDIVRSKVARDSSYVYFYVETRTTMTSRTDPNWMLLFIDSDCNPATGWQGYDYLVNYPTVRYNSTTLKKSSGGWDWTLVRNVAFRVAGNKMEIAVPRSDIGQAGDYGAYLDFHWADNIQKTNDITEFAVSGDSAPDRRFNYRYAAGPRGSIAINSGAAATNSTSVTLTLWATNAAEMRFLNTGDSTWSEWEPYAITKSWTLTSGDGTKSVEVQFKDTAGNVSATHTDSIILDTTPTGSITINSGDEYTNSTSVTLTLSTDEGGGVTEMTLRNLGFPFGDWEPYATSKPWTLTSGNGTKTVCVLFRDSAGNQSIQYTDSIILNATPPTVTSITPSSGPNTGTTIATNLVGTGFLSGAAVKLQKSGQSDITATGVYVAGSTTITCSFNLSGRATGLWDVVVTNPEGLSGTLTDGFGVTLADSVPAVGTTIASLLHPISAVASLNHRFRVRGKVEIIDSSMFWLDDGSGARIKVFAPGCTDLVTGDFASATGTVDLSLTAPLLLSKPADVQEF